MSEEFIERERTEKKSVRFKRIFFREKLCMQFSEEREDQNIGFQNGNWVLSFDPKGYFFN